MHSSVFEVSRKPILESKRAKAGHLPDWFYEQICDYAENPDLGQRQEAINQLHQNLGELCVLDGDSLTVSPQIRENYFRKSYDYFKAAAEALAQTDYKTFAGKGGTSAFHLALDGLNDSYEDKRGTYIYLAELGELITLDCWLRTADFSAPFYIGGTIKYHNKI